MRAGPAVLALAAVLAGPAGAALAPLAPGERLVVDDFEDITAWSAHPADGVKLRLSSDAGLHGQALRLDFGFSGGGYAVARRKVAIDLPADYRLRFAVRGECLPNDLELKLIDESGDNVWWHNRRGFKFPSGWDSLTSRKRHITFAWGPQGGGELRHIAAIEFAVTAGSGGSGTVWLDDFTLEALPPDTVRPRAPRASASSSAPDRHPLLAIDGTRTTAWVSGKDSLPWIALDFVRERELGGLALDWGTRFATDYAIEASSDGTSWRTLREVRDGNGGRDWLRLPETETRHLRLATRTPAPAGISIREIVVMDVGWAETPTRFLESVARAAPRGGVPRGMLGEPVQWTVVGLDGGRDEGLLSADGALETNKAQFSIEPFLKLDGRLYTWADVRTERRLAEGSLPIPTVTWKVDSLELSITAFAVGDSDHSFTALGGYGPAMIAQYRLKSRARRTTSPTLYLALRPFQVNPPVQSLNTPGGHAPIRSVAFTGNVAEVNGDRGVVSLNTPSASGATTFDAGEIVEHLSAGRLPAGTAVTDPFELGSGAFAYELSIPGGEEQFINLLIPYRGAPGNVPTVTPGAVATVLKSETAAWRERQKIPLIELPDPDVGRTLRAQLGWILVNRDSLGLQPGSRSYERSWIRDGALTSTALLRLGVPGVVREFLEWFARYQYPDGKIPCCVDARGADPVPEHDSSGEFLYLVAEYHRYTGDRATVERMWPAVRRAVSYLDSLRGLRRTAEWRAAGKEEFFGLLPPSISHEGYSAKPMHSYWDDFFALRGYKDAVEIATLLGRTDEAARFAASRDTFVADLGASIRAAMARHKIKYIPGCADLGDFDATSTTIALDPVAADSLLPAGALQQTFEGYWEFFRDRRDGKKPWEAFTPYEIRTIGAFVRLGWRDRAHELLAYFLAHRSPPEWAQWAEVVWNDRRTAHFIGDMPHTWVGSDYVRSVLDMLAYTREADQSLVVAAGVSWKWAVADSGVKVAGLPTPYGPLAYTLRATGDTLEVRIDTGVRVPPGGIVVSAPSPSAGKWKHAKVNGVAVDLRKPVIVRELPAAVRFEN